MTATETLETPAWSALIQIALTKPGSTGNTYCRFYHYSFTNQILLYLQGVTEPVATYKRWGELGHQVRKGSKAYAILRPITVKREGENGEEVSFTRFKTVKCLFTASQTDGPDLPPVEAPAWDLDAACAELDITKTDFNTVDGNVQGYSRAREYAINPAAVNSTRTTFHEIAHIVLGHTSDAGIAEYLRHRGEFEFQAEAVAYLVLNELGITDEATQSHSRAYIQEWLAGQTPSDKLLREVFTATDKILRAGAPQKIGV